MSALLFLLLTHFNSVPAAMGGEAREGTNVKVPGNIGPDISRGGVKNFLTPADVFARIVDEQRVKWAEPTPIRKIK